MKLSKAQLLYIKEERAKMALRLKDLDSFGDDIYKSSALSAERGRIIYNDWFYRHILNLHKVEVEADEEAQKKIRDRAVQNYAEIYYNLAMNGTVK